MCLNARCSVPVKETEFKVLTAPGRQMFLYQAALVDEDLLRLPEVELARHDMGLFDLPDL